MTEREGMALRQQQRAVRRRTARVFAGQAAHPDGAAADAALAALAAQLPRRSLFLEWGSAMGVVTALAALRGLRAAIVALPTGPREGGGTAEDGDADPAAVRAAQRMAGGLIWLATRSRPDVSFATSRLSSFACSHAWLSPAIRASPITLAIFLCALLAYLRIADIRTEFHRPNRQRLLACWLLVALADLAGHTDCQGCLARPWDCLVALSL